MANQLDKKIAEVFEEQKKKTVTGSTQQTIGVTVEEMQVKTEEEELNKGQGSSDTVTRSVVKEEDLPNNVTDEKKSPKKCPMENGVTETTIKQGNPRNITIDVEDECITEIPRDPEDFDVIDLCEDDDEDDGLDKDSALQLLYTKRFTQKSELLKSIYRSPKPKRKAVAPPIHVKSYNRSVNFVPLNLPDEPFIYLGNGRNRLQNIQVAASSSPDSSARSTPDIDEEKKRGDLHDTSVEIIQEMSSSPANQELLHGGDDEVSPFPTHPLFQEDRRGDPDIQMIDTPETNQRNRGRKTGTVMNSMGDTPLFIEFDLKSFKEAQFRKKRKKFTKCENKKMSAEDRSSRAMRVPSIDNTVALEATEQVPKKKKKRKNLDSSSAVNRAPADNIASLEGEGHHRGGLRPIAIDGPSISVGHGQGKVFSCIGLKLCIEYFQNRGHNVKAFLPRWRMRTDNQDTQIPTTNAHLLKRMDADNLLVLTPSKSYDDRYVVQYAAQTGAVIVSFDAYLDIKNEHPEWQEAVDKRRLIPTWADDILMFPKDPLGRNGPTLKEFLRFPQKTTEVVEIS